MFLIHGFSGTPATWMPLLPALERHHDVLAATLLGHRGGPEYLPGSPATPARMTDALEREMDSADFGRALLGPRSAQLMRRRRFRALALRCVVARPAEVPVALAVEMAEAAADCAISMPLLKHLAMTGFGELAAIDSPVQIVWGTRALRIRAHRRFSAGGASVRAAEATALGEASASRPCNRSRSSSGS
jgi:pimeloyl-ACP methyl ester carboxylesterase